MSSSPALSLSVAQSLLNSPQAIPALLSWLEQTPRPALDGLASLVFDLVKMGDEALAAPVLERMIALLPSCINKKNQAGSTILMEAVFFGRSHLANILLDAGAATGTVNTRGMDALGLAASLNSTSASQLANGHDLLEKGDFTQEQKDGALYYAAVASNLAMTRSLLDHGAGFAPSPRTGSALSAACRQSGDLSVEIVRTMLATDAGLASMNKEWGTLFPTTAAHYAAYVGNVPALSALIAAGARLDAPEESRYRNVETPLMSAASGTVPEAIDLLIKAGANPLAINHDGSNALHHLASTDRASPPDALEIRCLALLMAAGVDPFLLDGNGKSPVDLAAENGRHGLAAAMAALASSTRLATTTPSPEAPAATPGPRF